MTDTATTTTPYLTDLALARDAALAIMVASQPDTGGKQAEAVYFMASVIHDAAERLCRRIAGNDTPIAN